MVATGTREDGFGLAITTVSERAADLYREGQERWLSMAPDPGAAFAAAIAEDGDFALAHAGLALVQLREIQLAAARIGRDGRATRRVGDAP